MIGVGNSSSFAGYPPINPISGRAGHSFLKSYLSIVVFLLSALILCYNYCLPGSGYFTIFFFLVLNVFGIFLLQVPAGVFLQFLFLVVTLFLLLLSSCMGPSRFDFLSFRKILSFCFSLFFAITITII